MKSILQLTRATFLVIGFLTLLGATQAFAGGREESALGKTLEELVGPLPAHIQLSRAATVTVQVKVSNEGKIEVNHVDAAIPALTAHVRTRLHNAVLQHPDGFAGKSYRLLLKFEDPR